MNSIVNITNKDQPPDKVRTWTVTYKLPQNIKHGFIICINALKNYCILLVKHDTIRNNQYYAFKIKQFMLDWLIHETKNIVIGLI